jgi:hypothetical protein
VITTTLYDGQGIGNQLWSWATVKSIAKRNNYKFGIQAPWRFKGKNFLKIDFGEKVFGIAPKLPSPRKPIGIRHYYREKSIYLGDLDVSSYDQRLESVVDKTKIDGVFQCERYIYESKEDIARILEVERPSILGKGDCIIHIRGGDFKGNSRVSLPSDYYHNAMKVMLDCDPEMNFILCTNDVKHARDVLGSKSFKIISDYSDSEIYSGPDGKVDIRVERDFAFLQHARYAIIANSSFSWWGAWTNVNAKLIIAPKYWANHNNNGPNWSTGGILTRDWIYIDTMGKSFTYPECFEELGQHGMII